MASARNAPHNMLRAQSETPDIDPDLQPFGKRAKICCRCLRCEDDGPFGLCKGITNPAVVRNLSKISGRKPYPDYRTVSAGFSYAWGPA